MQSARYHAAPVDGGDAISTWQSTDALPSDFLAEVVLQAEPVGVQQNGFLVLDYQTPTDFKFVAAFFATNHWAIGHRTPTSWVKDVSFNQTIQTSTDYHFAIDVQGGTTVSLSVDGAMLGDYTFTDQVSDGCLLYTSDAADE